MKTLKCTCGKEITSDTEEDVLTRAVQHMKEAHGNQVRGMSDDDIKNMLKSKITDK